MEVVVDNARQCASFIQAARFVYYSALRLRLRLAAIVIYMFSIYITLYSIGEKNNKIPEAARLYGDRQSSRPTMEEAMQRRYRIAWSHWEFDPRSMRRDYQDHGGREFIVVTPTHIEVSPFWLTGDEDYACRIAKALGMTANGEQFRRLFAVMCAEAEEERLWRHEVA